MFNMKTIILFASRGNNVGKTTTAKKYASTLNSVEVYSFANPIRDHCDFLFKRKFNFDVKFTDFYQYRDMKDKLISDFVKDADNFSDLDGMTFRDFINQSSDEHQQSIGTFVWAEYGLKYIKNSDKNIILIDDFRRRTEGDFIKNHLKHLNYKFITVYLIKEDVKNQKHTHHEGLLEDYNFDIQFKINSDYSNLSDLFHKLNKLIGQKECYTPNCTELL